MARIRTTHTATVTGDALLHVFTPVNSRLRCSASGEVTPTGRKDVDLVTCPDCHTSYAARSYR